jgi:hypothetical protein
MMGLMMMDWSGLMTAGFMTVIAATVLASGLTVGYGLLLAHQWARWTGVVLAAMLTLCAAGGLIAIIGGAVMVATNAELGEFFQEVERAAEEPPTSAPADSGNAVPKPANDGGSDAPTQTLQVQNFVFAMLGFYGLPVAVGLLLGGTALWALLSRPTAAWFRFAAQIRAEHRLVRERLAE